MTQMVRTRTALSEGIDPALLFAPDEMPATGFFHAVEMAHSERAIAALRRPA